MCNANYGQKRERNEVCQDSRRGFPFLVDEDLVGDEYNTVFCARVGLEFCSAEATCDHEAIAGFKVFDLFGGPCKKADRDRDRFALKFARSGFADQGCLQKNLKPELTSLGRCRFWVAKQVPL